MRLACALMAPLALAACMEAAPEEPAAAAAPATDTDRVVAAIEANGCQLDPNAPDAVLIAARVGNARLAEIGAALVADGRASLNPNGVYELKTDTCI